MDRERVMENQTVVVRDGRITALGAAGSVAIPPGVIEVDGAGKFLTPGLLDMHIHLSGNRRTSERMLGMWAGMGVTSVAVLNGSNMTLAIRSAAEQGSIVSPRIFSSGPTIRGGPPATREEGVAMVRAQHGRGYDLIKVYNQIPEPAYQGIIDEARRLDIPVIGHAVRSVGIEGALEAGQHIAHMEELVYGYFRWRQPLPRATADRRTALRNQLDVSRVPDLARRVAESGVYVIPNLVAYNWILKQVDDIDVALGRPEIAYMPESIMTSWRPPNRYTRRPRDAFLATLSETFQFLQLLTKKFQDAGVPLMVGSDAPVPVTVPGYGVHEELEELVTAGLTPYEALVAATRTPAKFLRLENDGTVVVGHRADLVLLDRNPLEDIRNTRAIAGVVLNGRWLSRDALGRLVNPEGS